ncbi:MAG: hypothetical protein FWC99_04135 [Coriobacteriia bacterium]|nr:hypothetical protein [Coriobacteriia bacterium]
MTKYPVVGGHTVTKTLRLFAIFATTSLMAFFLIVSGALAVLPANTPSTLTPFSALLRPAQAYAADFEMSTEPPDINQADVAQFRLIQYKFFRAPDGYTAAIWGMLDPNTVELPALVQVAVPQGADVFWFGPVPEGGVTSESPQFTHYHVYTDGENDIYTVMLTDSHDIQIEHYFWGENFPFPVRTMPDGDHAIRISYTPLHDVEILRLAAFLPEGSAARDSANVEFLGTGPTGDPAFAMDFHYARGGENYTAEIVYAPPEVTARHNQPTMGGGILAVIGTVAAAIVVVGGFLVFIRLRKKGQNTN